jgi:hypothetical protein
VTDGVITREQADMIGATRLEDVPVRDYAAAHGMDIPTFWQARWRAERRLVAWLTGGDTAPDTVAEPAGAHRAGSGGNLADAVLTTAGHAAHGAGEQRDSAAEEETGRLRASGRAGLRTASTTPAPARASASQTGRRPGDRRPPARPPARRPSRAVTGSGRGQAEKPRRPVSGNGDLQTN